MEFRGCGTTHFIQTIRGGLLLKVRNIISHGRPVIRSKSLKDVYMSEDAKRPQKLPSGLVFDYQQVKHEGPCFLVVDRTLQEIKPETDELAPCADDVLSGGLDDDTTLKQLKKRLFTRKRKRIPIDENTQRDITHEKAVQDESDLNEPLINWKTKHSKTSKAKRKYLKTRVISSSTIDVPIKSEENLVSECSPQVGGGPASVCRVKVEVPDTEQLDCQNKTSSGDASPIGHNEVSNPCQKTVLNEHNREPLLCVNTYENCATNEISYDHLDDVQPISILFPWEGTSVKLETPETACRDSPDLPSVEIEKQTEIPDSHPVKKSLSEDPNPDPCCYSRSYSNVEGMPEERSIAGTQVPDMAIVGCMGLHQECNYGLSEDKTEAAFPYEPNDSWTSLDKKCGSKLDSITPIKTDENQTLIEFTISDKEQPLTCSIMSEELNCEGHIEDESLKAEDKHISAFTMSGAENEPSLENRACDSAETEADFPYEPNSRTSLDKNCGSNLDSITPSKAEENQSSVEDAKSDKEQASACSIMSKELNCEGHIEEESLKNEDKKNSMTGAENEYSLENRTCDRAETTLIPESFQPPERLLSTRKAFSPSSQEQLRLAMNSDEICNISNQNIVLECKEKLFENQTEKKNSSPRSNIQNDEVTANHRRPGHVSQRKVTISPRRIIRKSQLAKGNLEGPRCSRALPNVSTACASVQCCSEGAVAFSQRQLHDMETVAEKLMNELKSMKDIVEQKLLFESYRNTSVKNEADEVKSAINNATKVEETAKRWMSMMARDCTRFCKIMKMTPDSTSASKDSIPREKRKIVFADEAGGELCHIKLFDNGIAATEAELGAVKQ